MVPKAVDASVVRLLRQEVLRPHQTPAQLIYPGDAAPETLHAAVSNGARVVGVATVSSQAHPNDPRSSDWRIRGMATTSDMRGRGIGAALLAYCEAHARAHGGGRLWCNARAAARGFYQRAGFAIEGDAFELPTIGPHYLMSKPL